MALDAGTKTAEAGMSAAIYQAMESEFSPPLSEAITNAKSDEERQVAQKSLRDARESWKKLSYCIAKGVVEHIKTNLEITGLRAAGNVTSGTSVSTQQIEPTMGLVS